MTKEFERSFKLILEAEGGYSNISVDRGGPTNMGITMATLSEVLERKATINDVQSLTVESARRIYHERYWLPMNLDTIACDTLQLLLMDQAVNVGKAGCTKRIQNVLKIPATLNMDLNTVAKINKSDRVKTCFDFIIATQDFYIDIVKRRPDQIIFLVGWLNRCEKLWHIVRENVEFKK